MSIFLRIVEKRRLTVLAKGVMINLEKYLKLEQFITENPAWARVHEVQIRDNMKEARDMRNDLLSDDKLPYTDQYKRARMQILEQVSIMTDRIEEALNKATN